MPPAAKELVPYVKADQSPREFTVRAVVLGIVLCILFGMANAFLGLKIGLTVASSIPCAVISMAVLRRLMRGLYRFVMKGLNVFKDTVSWTFEGFNKAGIAFELSSLLFGVGYLIGMEVAAVMFAGGVLGDMILVPLIDYVAQGSTTTYGT